MKHAQLSFLRESLPKPPMQPEPDGEIVVIPAVQPIPPASDLIPVVSEANTKPAPALPQDSVKVRPSKHIAKPVPKDDERYLSVKEVAGRYSVSVQTVWRHTKDSPEFPKPIKVLSGSTRWKLRDLVAYEAFRQEDA
ncbi:hypothetical protein D3C73_474760 [compost metagenome]